MYLEVSGSQAGEIKVRKGVGGVDRFGGPREGARVNIGESEIGRTGAETTGRGINIQMKNLRRGGQTYRSTA